MIITTIPGCLVIPTALQSIYVNSFPELITVRLLSRRDRHKLVRVIVSTFRSCRIFMKALKSYQTHPNGRISKAVGEFFSRCYRTLRYAWYTICPWCFLLEHTMPVFVVNRVSGTVQVHNYQWKAVPSLRLFLTVTSIQSPQFA